ncbi:hypothetical protein LCGC14_2801040 [marine sediment metagenome]|uniref:Uncharacterized protein n=1 Tax=marine sediment metagenome TaxID=412755 RepID=A0A0F8YMS0_9ZZZZ
MEAERIAPAEDFAGLIAVVIQSWEPQQSKRSKKMFGKAKLSNGDFVYFGNEISFRRLGEQIRMTYPKVHLESPEEILDFLRDRRLPIVLERRPMQALRDDIWFWAYSVPKTKGD